MKKVKIWFLLQDNTTRTYHTSFGGFYGTMNFIKQNFPPWRQMYFYDYKKSTEIPILKCFDNSYPSREKVFTR